MGGWRFSAWGGGAFPRGGVALFRVGTGSHLSAMCILLLYSFSGSISMVIYPRFRRLLSHSDIRRGFVSIASANPPLVAQQYPDFFDRVIRNPNRHASVFDTSLSSIAIVGTATNGIISSFTFSAFSQVALFGF